MTMLTFSVSFVTLAQQSSGQAGAAAAEEVNAVRLAAINAAESDANSDINKLACFSAGAAAAIIGSGCAAFYLGETYYTPTLPVVAAYTAGFASGAGIFTTLVGAYSYPPHPPFEKLIGKSPEYVISYAEAYRAKTRSLRITSALAGTAIVGGGVTFLFGWLSLNQGPDPILD